MSWNDQDIDRLFQGAKAPEPPPLEEAFWTEMEAMLPPENVDVDNLFKGATAPAPPPFREAYWTEMEAMLPQKKRRAAAIWWFSGGAAMVLLLAGTLWHTAGTDGTTTNKQVIAEEKSAVSSEKDAVSAHTDDVTNGASETIESVSSDQDAVASNTTKIDNAGPQNTGRKSSVPVDGPSRNAPINSQNGLADNGRSSTVNPVEDVHQGESLPEQTAGTISATTGTVNPLNPLPFEYALDDVSRRLPDAKLPKPARFYAQLSMGIGQSAQRNVIGSSDFLHYYAAGGGLYTRVDNMVLTFGLNGRVDFTDNIVRTVGTETPGNRIETSYKQLYSIETPASLGYTLGRNLITATVTPGFQTGFSGQEREFVAETQVRSERASGKVKNSRTLTMEFGLSYWRVLQPDWQIGAAVNFDALRPFNNNLFAGEQRMAPLNGQIILRRTF